MITDIYLKDHYATQTLPKLNYCYLRIAPYCRSADVAQSDKRSTTYYGTELQVHKMMTTHYAGLCLVDRARVVMILCTCQTVPT